MGLPQSGFGSLLGDVREAVDELRKPVAVVLYRA